MTSENGKLYTIHIFDIDSDKDYLYSGVTNINNWNIDNDFFILTLDTKEIIVRKSKVLYIECVEFIEGNILNRNRTKSSI